MKGNVLGSIDFTLTPYLKYPVSLIGNGQVEMIGAIAPTQSGKTVFLQVAVADAIDQDPGSLLYILPDEKSAKKNIKDKVIDVINESPELNKHCTGNKKDMNYMSVSLDHMNIHVGWAGGLASMSSTPYKRVVWDEVRLMRLTTGEESNAIKLGQDRLTTYVDMGIGQGYMVSSPSVEGDLLHQQLSIPNTTVLYWNVPCLECGEYQYLDFFKNVKFEKESVVCQCQFCGAKFSDSDKKRTFNQYGIYAPFKRSFQNSDECKINQDGTLVELIDTTSRMFFRWNSLVSPFRSFQRIWNEFIQTKDKLHDYRNFIQCWLAEFWINDISRTSVLSLEERKSQYRKRDVHPGTKLVTGGVDTQDNGFYVTFRAWGHDKESWLIDEFFVQSDIDTATYEDLLLLFRRDILGATYSCPQTHEIWKPALVGIDTGGHRTSMIYDIAPNFPELVLVKGAHDSQKSTWQYNKEKNLYLVRTREYLEETELISDAKNFHLPANVSKDFLTQWCNIRKKKRLIKTTGEESISWVKIGQCDYRFADIHSFIVLDLPLDRGKFRAELEKTDFKYNPWLEEKKAAERRSSYQEDTDDSSGYSVGDFNW